MVDLKDLKSQPDQYRDSARLRGVAVDIDKILELEAERAALLPQVEASRAVLNLKGKPTAGELADLQQQKSELGKLEDKLRHLEEELGHELAALPNLLAPDTPAGGEEAGESLRQWGEAKTGEDLVDHQTLAESQGWLDFERGAKVAGNKFYYLKGSAVRLEMAVMRLVMDHLERSGFTLISTPHLVTARVFEGSGFQPRGEEEQYYQVEGEDLRLIGTAEIAMTGYHADEILDPTTLPLVYAALTPSYRREAGAYGKHSRGLYRVHQFNKLEMYVFCAATESEDWHQRLLTLEEEICQLLEIPYRVVRIAAGDLGAPAYKKYDLEYWSPVEGVYRELTSCSNCTDFQARRLNIRTRDESGKTVPVHTLNGTAVAFSRLFIALLENHQASDGSVSLPQALHNYYGGDTL